MAALAVVTCFSFFVLANRARRLADDLWSQLGLAQTQANQNINNSFLYGAFYYGGAKNAKHILSGDRVAVVNGLVAYARKYSNSPEFKAAYKTYRDRRKPAEPVREPVTAESVRARERQRLENNLKTAEAGLTSTNPMIRNGAPGRVESIKKELAALDQPDNPTVKRRLDEAARTYESWMKQHQAALQKFEQQYPEDPKALLKKRLQEILDITSDVDYAAELKEAYGKKVFVNPVYEKKPDGWKLAFRAGKPATDAVRAAAQQWLRELP